VTLIEWIEDSYTVVIEYALDENTIIPSQVREGDNITLFPIISAARVLVKPSFFASHHFSL